MLEIKRIQTKTNIKYQKIQTNRNTRNTRKIPQKQIQKMQTNTTIKKYKQIQK